MSQFILRAHPGIEEKAKLLQDNNQVRYRALADEMFAAPRIGFTALETTQGIGPNKIPTVLENVIKDRMVYAEMQYRQGHGKPVTEQQIVEFHNILAKEFELPAYTYVNKVQVRQMRMLLIAQNPTLMAYGLKDNMKIGESIPDELSPFQAVHLAIEVMGHKLMNSNFQYAPGEWERHEEARKQGIAAAINAGDTGPRAVHTISKFSEVRDPFLNHINRMGTVEALGLIEKGFDTFGIGR